ncbi:predicted protein [Histoplasma capsulatum var. duboisii H88]|uniref:Predicted protein n=2 Tax=Ajellomyces capsulatus TaxID=5037 RepID=F0US29_AJEC8|nr:predicted protein [Histoplasma capsulatum H143]EGC48706.1 predicted protein [Histoplasma capsulatum var. duboisii H88]
MDCGWVWCVYAASAWRWVQTSAIGSGKYQIPVNCDAYIRELRDSTLEAVAGVVTAATATSAIGNFGIRFAFVSIRPPFGPQFYNLSLLMNRPVQRDISHCLRQTSTSKKRQNGLETRDHVVDQAGSRSSGHDATSSRKSPRIDQR